MKKLLLFSILAILGLTWVGCDNKDASKCHISGTIPAEYNGKRIFLVPFTDSRREVVDSVVIEDGKFEFTRDTVMLAKILLDYHFRMGVEPLLVIVEPGEVKVSIDSVSHAGGTAQNDSLEQWKVRKQSHDQEMIRMNIMIEKLKKDGKTQEADTLKQEKDRFHLAFKNYTRQMVVNLKEGVLHDFLNGFYPKTYKRKMPDGKEMIIDADTNEPISQ